MRAVFEKVTTDAGRFFRVKRRNDPRFDFLWHYHREFELTLIVQSRGRRFVGDNIEEYEDGDLVLLGPNLPHTWCSAPAPASVKHQAVVVQFDPDFLGPQRLEGLRLDPVRDLLERGARGLRFGGATRAEVSDRMERIERHPPLRQLGELLVILDLLARSEEATVLSSRTFVPQVRPDAAHPIDKVCKYINGKYLERIPLAQAARVLAMSPSAFSRFFRRTTGKTFVGYLNELRLGHACQLLMETERGIADIASASGFSNLSHFNRFFLRAKKMRPREFRREHRRFQRGAA